MNLLQAAQSRMIPQFLAAMGEPIQIVTKAGQTIDTSAIIHRDRFTSETGEGIAVDRHIRVDVPLSAHGLPKKTDVLKFPLQRGGDIVSWGVVDVPEMPGNGWIMYEVYRRDVLEKSAPGYRREAGR